MAKDGEKPTRDAQQQKPDDKQSQAKDRSKASGANENEFVQQMRSQRQTLEAALDKRNQDEDITTIVREFAKSWIPYDDLEVELLFPAMVSGGVEETALAELVIRHDIINLVLADLLSQPDQDPAQAKLEVLAAEYAALRSMEDRLGDVPERFEAAKKASPGLIDEMRERHEAHRRRLERVGDELGSEAIGALAPRSLSVRPMRRQARREQEMQRYQNYRDRDEQGRFLPEDERGGGRGYDRMSRGRYEDEDRDERRARSRYDEDERYRGEDEARGRGRGGWFGDPEGHSEASRRGWRSSHHGESGWYGDPEGHSQASRRGWEEREDDERRGNGDRGRFAEGERYRGARFSEDERYRGGRFSEDERHGGYERGYEMRGRGHGGWYGDPERHSQASRRVWEERESEFRPRERDDDERDRRRSRYDH